MLHARTDYQRRFVDAAVLNPSLLSPGSTPIGEDEPVFLVRAKDLAFVATVMAWIKAHDASHGDPAMSLALNAHLGRATAWREKHGVKAADAPPGTLLPP